MQTLSVYPTAQFSLRVNWCPKIMKQNRDIGLAVEISNELNKIDEWNDC